MSKVSQWSTIADNNNAAPPDGWPENMARSAVNDAARENMAALAKWYRDTRGSLVSGGTGNAYTLTTNSGHAALADQSILVFRADRANTGAATLNVDGLGAKGFTALGGTALAAGNLAANQMTIVIYNSQQDRYELLGSITAIADQSAAEAGSAADKLMTPERTNQAIAALAHRILHMQDQKASGTSAGSSLQNNTQVRTLNQVVTNTISGASLGSNQITLPAGTYDVWARAPGFRVGAHKASFYNFSDSSVALIGSSANVAAAEQVQTDSIVIGRVTIASSKSFELRHFTSNDQPTNGLGIAAGAGIVEVYAEVLIRKVS